ncbi:hypothetical protein COS54_02185 [Candidatus Shapirobacteria bacterium CG03_land_8_20_14_0_80_39_12]|uniref:Uncharacterized protein n=1 Tax=Candidatus Shapirobacteria bacterium CG03_land_8_20_14_0_80_39_12 TaxID=1974879 RepID=A0A2M7BCS0_9BACT|nr:MAG: hypothetical protein COS54_02185 [Candidatus Shapirobacteria bacterium CG03_land_8_20_14_0_80_39_12]
MLESLHSLTGAVIAYKIGNPALAFPLAFLSHFACDLLPHWNPEIYKEKKKLGHLLAKTNLQIIIDCLLGLFFGLFIAFKALPSTIHFLTVIGGSFFAILPDLAEAPFYYLNVKASPILILTKFQRSHQFKTSFWFGITFQIVYAIFLLSLVW